MGQRCKAFGMKDAQAAWEHMDLEILKDYGDEAYGHLLHVWDDGKRLLARCRKCGGYVLVQKSEYHDFTGDEDSYYTDWFFLESAEEAEKLNRRYSGGRTGPRPQTCPDRTRRRDRLRQDPAASGGPRTRSVSPGARIYTGSMEPFLGRGQHYLRSEKTAFPPAGGRGLKRGKTARTRHRRGLPKSCSGYLRCFFVF